MLRYKKDKIVYAKCGAILVVVGRRRGGVLVRAFYDDDKDMESYLSPILVHTKTEFGMDAGPLLRRVINGRDDDVETTGFRSYEDGLDENVEFRMSKFRSYSGDEVVSIEMFDWSGRAETVLMDKKNARKFAKLLEVKR